jgi:hypothetical protein
MECGDFLMIFKYFVEFDDDGEIKALHTDKVKGAKEYIVKLIPIERSEKELSKLGEEMKKSAEGSKKFRREIDKITRDLRRIKI